MLKLIKIMLLSCLLLTNQCTYSKENVPTANPPQKTFFSNWPHWLPTLTIATAGIAGCLYGAGNHVDLANRFKLPMEVVTEEIAPLLNRGLPPYWEEQLLESQYYKPYAAALGIMLLNVYCISICRKIAPIFLEPNEPISNDQKLNNKIKLFNNGVATCTLSIAAISSFLTGALVVTAKLAYENLGISIADAVVASHLQPGIAQ